MSEEVYTKAQNDLIRHIDQEIEVGVTHGFMASLDAVIRETVHDELKKLLGPQELVMPPLSEEDAKRLDDALKKWNGWPRLSRMD